MLASVHSKLGQGNEDIFVASFPFIGLQGTWILFVIVTYTILSHVFK